MTQRVLVLGGGYTGIWAARRLAKELKGPLDRHEVELVAVSAVDHHNFHGWTGEFLGGIIPLEHKRTPLLEALPRTRLIVGTAEAVDIEKNHAVIRTEHALEQRIDFTHVVFATGSADARDKVPGLSTFGYALKGRNDLPELRDHVLECLERADATRDVAMRSSLLTFVIAGGGFSGVEMTAALAELLWAERDKRPGLQAVRPRIVLVHSSDALLPELRPRFHRLADYATDQLLAYGIVELRPGLKLAEVTPQCAVLSDGSLIETATVLSTVGQSRMRLPGTEKLSRDEDGRLKTDRFLRVEGCRHVWAGGDVAAVPMAYEREPCPTNALWAIHHGEALGQNLGRLLCGKTMSPFTYPGLGQAASVGVGKGMTEVYGVQFTGWLGWVARLSFFLWFMPDRTRAAQVVDDWLRHARSGGERHLERVVSDAEPWLHGPVPSRNRVAALFRRA